MNVAQQAIETFCRVFGGAPTHEFYAPGRVNLIGEHTDYNDGFVLPAAINFGTAIVTARRDDSQMRVCAANFDEDVVEFDVTQPLALSQESTWANYVRGVCHTLKKHGYRIPGLNICISGDVPHGAGLSSSAALEIVLIRTITAMNAQTMDPTMAALLGQETENDFIGAKTGIMDQLIIACGEKDKALLIDCRDLSTKAYAMDPGYKIVIINSNVKRGLVDSAYNERREQCRQATDILGVKALRDADMTLLDTHKAAMSEVIYRRARHVITENERTLAAANALSQYDWVRMGELMAASHESMKSDFEITVPAIDGLVNLIAGHLPPGKGGARMTGGGFGGCVVALVEAGYVDSVIEKVQTAYESRFGLKESIYICQAVDGAFMAG